MMHINHTEDNRKSDYKSNILKYIKGIEKNSKVDVGGNLNSERESELLSLISTLLFKYDESSSLNGEYLSLFNDIFTGSMTEVKIPEGVTYIAEFSFHYLSLINSMLPSAVSLKTVYIPSSVLSIGDSAFYNCGLKNIYISEGLSFIGLNAFANCPIESIVIPNSVGVIDRSAFSNCLLLKSTTIGNKIRNIGNFAFSYCIGLLSVTIHNVTPPTLNSGAFANDNNLAHIYVPAESVEAYKTATNWTQYASIIEAIENE